VALANQLPRFAAVQVVFVGQVLDDVMKIEPADGVVFDTKSTA
jgi:hypothetical protein